MEYTIVKQVIGEVDIMPCVDMVDCLDTMNEVYDEMYKEGISYRTEIRTPRPLGW